jgi:NTE family protein
MKADAVFQGGGVKGIGFAGALCAFEEHEYEWERVAGTSAGAIAAALISVGYSGKELKEVFSSCDYMRFLDKHGLQRLPLVGNVVGLLAHKAFYSGQYIEQWLKMLFEVKGKTRFKDVSFNGESRLKITASDVTKRKLLILPDDLKDYGIDPMEFEIAKAVRMSASIPFYFRPVKIKNEASESLIVDGALISNFPIWIFDVQGLPRWPTIGFKLGEARNSSITSNKTDICSFLLDVIGTVADRDEEIYLRDKDAVRTVSIPTLGVRATQFNISKKQNEELFESGYKAAKNFIKQWNFTNYINKYRTAKIHYFKSSTSRLS